MTRDKFFLDAERSVLVVIDVQEKLCSAMDEDTLRKLSTNISILGEAAKELGIPALITEQYVKGLGGTIQELVTPLDGAPRFEKMSFSCCGIPTFVDALKASGRTQVVITGMETHVCVLQTAIELIEAGYTVHLAKDAVMSRSKQNWKTAVDIMRQAGAVVTVTESVLFQWLKVAGTDSFKKLSKLVR